MRKVLITLVVLILAILAGCWLGEHTTSWSQSPVVTTVPRVYLPAVVSNWDGTPAPTPTPVPLPKLQGVGHDRKWEQNEADWLCPALTLSGVSWYYDWTPYPIQCPGVESVPMIWDETQTDSRIEGTSDYILIFNEPEFQSQANLTPTQGAVYYHSLSQRLSDYKLVGPGVVHLWWIEEFWTAYESMYGAPPRMDALAIHTYPQLLGDAPASVLIDRSIADVQAAIDFAAEHDIPEVWVTEFAVQPRTYGPQHTIDYMQGMVEWFETQPTITRWAWFGLDLTGFWYLPDNPAFSALYDTSLVLDGELTPFGEVYR